MNELLTVNQAAEKLHSHPETIREWLRVGKLKGHKPGRKYLIPISSIETFLETTISTDGERVPPAETESK